MKSRTIFTTILISFTLFNAFSQSKRVADRYFNELAYYKASELYEAIYKKGDTSKSVIQRLADSYYNNAETKKAESWLDTLLSKHKDVESDYLFKYAQVLRSNKNYKKSDSIFKVIENNDVANIKGNKYIVKDDYLEKLSNSNIKIGIRNLAVNTKFSDFGGFIYKGNVYYASSKPKGLKREKVYKWNNQPFLNIYKSEDHVTTLENSETDSIYVLDVPKRLSAPVNTEFHESSPVITKDGKVMYFTRVNYDGKKLRKDRKNTVNLKLYKAFYRNNKWTDIEELPFNDNEYSVGHPALSPDEKTLYFASDMPGSVGKTDIYKVSITEDGYGDPVNLGTEINTKDKEMFPYFSEDGKLYFSSNGHLGLGLLDIFQAEKSSDETFKNVKNLGHPFNSERDDFSFYIDENNKKGFFSSNRKKGKGDDDIYSFFIYGKEKELEPDPCIQVVTGVVRDEKSKAPLEGATVQLMDRNGIVLKEYITNSLGLYKFDELPCEIKDYKVFASRPDHKSNQKQFASSEERNKEFKVNLNLIPLVIDNQIVINPIYFDYNKANIREDSQYELENVIKVMKSYPSLVIKIESHTDSRGRRSYNRSLSDKRAKSTRDYIISRGIASNRIEKAIGYGEDKLLNDCDDKRANKCTEEEHQLNRRSYFYIIRGGEQVEVQNRKPRVIDRDGYRNEQKVIDKKLRNRKNIRVNLMNYLRKNNFLRKQQQDKCFKEGECK